MTLHPDEMEKLGKKEQKYTLEGLPVVSEETLEVLTRDINQRQKEGTLKIKINERRPIILLSVDTDHQVEVL